METIFTMSPLEWIIFWFSIGAYGPLVLGAVKEKEDKSQVFTTWFLYFLLDINTMFSSNRLGSSSDKILFGFTIGSFVMMSILFFQKRIAWTWLETSVTLLVLICLVAWHYSSHLVLRLGILSECIVGIYLIIKTFKNPVVKYNLTGYILFLITSILAMINAKDWSIEEMGYPLSEAILCIVTILPLLIKWWKYNKK